MVDIKERVISLVNNKSLIFTDIQIETGKPIMIRRPTGWKPASDMEGIVSQEDVQEFLGLLDEKWAELLDQNGSFDRPVELSSCRLRCNAYYTNGKTGFSISIRKHAAAPLPFDQLGLPNQIKNCLSWSKGLIIVTGATGSGKTTTLASMLDYINENRHLHLITIENPIEYRLVNKKSIVSQIEIPTDTPTFSAALRGSMRQKPDVVMIGEVRDKDTADSVFQGAESGHLIMATLHTSSAQGAINKLLSFFPAEEQKSRAKMLSNSLTAIVCQSMLPRENEDGSVVVHEILFNSTAQTQQMIGDVEKHQNINEFLTKSIDKVSCHMNTNLLKLLKERKISLESALRASHSPMSLRDEIAAAKGRGEIA